jgi:hypothetical protein
MHEKTKSHLASLVQEQFTTAVNAVEDRKRAKVAVDRKKKELEECEALFEAATAVEEVQSNTLFALNDKAELINAGTTAVEARRLLDLEKSKPTAHPDTIANQANMITAIISDQKGRPNG